MNHIAQKVEHLLKKKVSSVSPVSGGSISTTAQALLDDGRIVFIKTSPQQKDMFLKEANGLNELTKARAIKIPAVLFADQELLIIEYLPPSSPSNRKKFFEEFGRQFAQLHRCTSDSFGFFEDNYIGSTLQKNLPCSNSWRDFYHVQRLLFQFQLAERNDYADNKLQVLFRALEKNLDNLILEDGEPPALLHGDLWSGNYLCTENDTPAIIDPAVYYGHREADLAMTMLFGGFGDSFYSSYRESFPLQPGWQKRIELYKLYHLFNHLNLFGEEYYGQVVAIMKELAL
jgi:protein-ribulosamine 3-kinase